MSDKKPKITFSPSFFESFDGTQEELDALVSEVTKILEEKVANGEYEDIERTIVGSVEEEFDFDAAVEQYGVDKDGFIKYPFTIH